jgi:hypothetical protein
VAARGFSDKKEEKNAEQGKIRCGPRGFLRKEEESIFCFGIVIKRKTILFANNAGKKCVGESRLGIIF